jgi:hypothetical protein
MTTDLVVLPGLAVLVAYPTEERVSWRTWGLGGRWDVEARASVLPGRSSIVEALASAGILWPLVDAGPSCRRCAVPREPHTAGEVAECRGCHALARVYADALTDLFPVTYTAPRWWRARGCGR